ncbi:MAG TPA: archaeosortase/exosortase family protein, partial [Chthoniobacterales bacterium]
MPARAKARNLLNPPLPISPMNATASATAASNVTTRTRVDWLAITAFALLWVEIVSRLRFEWSVNPQYGYGWTVPFLAAYIFWRRIESTPAAERPAATLFPALIIFAAGLLLIPV